MIPSRRKARCLAGIRGPNSIHTPIADQYSEGAADDPEQHALC